MIKLSMIAAVSENGVIGLDNQLPWRLPGDLKFFKRVTMGKPIIMGRLTYDSIGRSLPGRINIVLTSQKGWCAEGVEVCNSISDAINLASYRAEVCGAREAIVIGGEQIYRQAISLAARLYLTRVNGMTAGDAYFPDYKAELWHEKLLGKASAQEGVPGYQFVMLDRNS